MDAVYFPLALALVILIGLVALRVRSRNTIDVRSSDIVLALLPLVLWMFLTGKIEKLGFGDLTITRAIDKAAKEPVAKQVQTALPIEAVPITEKGGESEIQEAINKKSQALSFRLGRGGYYRGGAIMEYLDRLTQYPYLRYLILNHGDGKFFGLVDARQLAGLLRNPQRQSEPPSPTPTGSYREPQQRSGGGTEPRLTANNLANWLNANTTTELETLPGFIGAENALPKSADRKQALQAMNNLEVPTIPVVDEKGIFIGTIDRSKLTASILTDIAAKVDKSD